MPLEDTGRAIGAVTKLLDQFLSEQTGIGVTVGRPQPGSGGNGDSRATWINLFLYEAQFDPSLKNVSLDDGQPPLWLSLKYLLTTYDGDGESDSADAHETMGRALRALQELSYLFLDRTPPLADSLPDAWRALKDNPEVLKLTFDAIDAELIAKLMQSTDEHYRLSTGFQVRPVMIATGELPSYSLLVGVDHTAADPVVREGESVQIPAIPSMGPTIDAVQPPQVAPGETLTVTGRDLHRSSLVVRLGGIDLPVTSQRPNRLQCSANVLGLDISAGSHALSVVQMLPGGRRRSSNLLVAALRPTLSTAMATGVAASPSPPNVIGNINMEGKLLGREGDDIFVGLYRDGAIVKLLDDGFNFPAGPADAANQLQLTLVIQHGDTVPPGRYRVILRVNGQQATTSPEIDLTPTP